jgi:hypothetical protein
LESERSEFAFHDLESFDGLEREAFLGLFDGFFLGIWPEFPVNDDDPSLRQVFEWGDDTIPELTGRCFLDLKRSHAFDDSTVSR